MRIKVVVQRYGKEILGGAEHHAAVMAGLLARHHDVEVLTTTAQDYNTWAEAYPAGPCEVDGVRVRRFPVRQGRAPGWEPLSLLLHEGFDGAHFAALSSAEREAFATRVRSWPDPLQEAFIRGQGPVAPDLTHVLAQGEYDRVLFVTYLYPTTFDGLLAVAPEKALVVPTLHDEAAAYLPIFGRRLARGTLLCSTPSEVRLVERLYPRSTPHAELLGYGIDVPPDPGTKPPSKDPFLLFAGRIDPQKGIGALLAWYETLRRVDPNPPRLVLIGEASMPLPAIPGVEAPGFVSEDEKRRLMREALAFVHPSPFESLGIVLLEALSARTPILVNAQSEVMVDHCRDSGAGVWVASDLEFAAAVARLRNDTALTDALGENGRRYVEERYGIAAYERRLLEAFVS